MPYDETARVRGTGRGAFSSQESPVPTDEKLPDGQYKDHWVLSEQERAKGFVRPVRTSYRHVGISGPRHPLRDLTPEEHERYDAFNYVKFEAYPADPESSVTGRYWTQEQLDSVNGGCGYITIMGLSIAETYARDPHFYGSTFCAHCGNYFRVGQSGEFVWEGTDERVGT